MKPQDPPRMLESEQGLEPELARLLHAGRHDMPGPGELASLSARLGPLLGDVPAGPAPVAPTGGVAPWVVPGLGALVAISGLVLAGLTFVVERPTPGPPPEQPAVAAAEPETVDAPAPVVEDLQAEPPGSGAAPADAAAEQPPRRRAPQPGTTTLPAQDPVAELVLLDEAQRALDAAPGHALARTARHRARYPHGAYAQEREVIAIEALMRLGRHDQARARAQRFLRRHPESSHGRKVQLQLDRLQDP